MRALFDISMLLALCDPQHVRHVPAQHWRQVNAAHGWASCPLTQNGFLRISSQRGYSNPLRLPEAFSILDRLTGRADHAFWPDDISLLHSAAVDRKHVLSHRALTDVYLLALAVRHGGRLVTLDANIAAAAAVGATAAQLVVI